MTKLNTVAKLAQECERKREVGVRKRGEGG